MGSLLVEAGEGRGRRRRFCVSEQGSMVVVRLAGRWWGRIRVFSTLQIILTAPVVSPELGVRLRIVMVQLPLGDLVAVLFACTAV